MGCGKYTKYACEEANSIINLNRIFIHYEQICQRSFCILKSPACPLTFFILFPYSSLSSKMRYNAAEDQNTFQVRYRYKAWNSSWGLVIVQDCSVDSVSCLCFIQLLLNTNSAGSITSSCYFILHTHKSNKDWWDSANNF